MTARNFNSEEAFDVVAQNADIEADEMRHCRGCVSRGVRFPDSKSLTAPQFNVLHCGGCTTLTEIAPTLEHNT